MSATDGAPALLATIDWVVIAVYVGGLIALGLAMSRRHVGPADYFLASRATQWPAIGLAMLASNMSSTALVGLAGGAYAIGIAVYDYEWTATVVLVFFCVFLLPFVIRSQTFTMPEFLERRYDRRVRVQFALMSLFLIIFVDAAGVLYSGALVCRLLFPMWPLWLIVAALAAAAGIYTTLGGLRAVIYTEAVQAIVLLAGALMISICAFRGGSCGLVPDSPDRRCGRAVAGTVVRDSAAGILLLVHESVDRAAGAVGEEHRPREVGRAFRGVAEASGLVPDRAAGDLRAVVVSPLATRRHRISDVDIAVVAQRADRTGRCRVHRLDHGIHRLDAQFCVHSHHHGRGEAVESVTR
jgi:hypothetical protein